MMLIKPARFDDPNFLKNQKSTSVDNFPTIFLAGCQMYKLAQYEKAAEHFKKILESKDKQLYYETRFNLGACMFKMGEFKYALKQFALLMSESKNIVEEQKMTKIANEVDGGKRIPERKFVGRDRRLYFNKALCEL